MSETSPEAFAIDNGSLRDKVADHVRHLIFSGRLRGGDKINQEQMAASLGLSKLPVREGLILLEAQGLVVNVPRRGGFVQILTEEDILDHYRAYGALCGIAAERAVEVLSKGDLEGLKRNLRSFEDDQVPSKLAALNLDFHRVIFRAGCSNLLAAMLSTLGKTLPEEIFYGREHGDWLASAVREHRAILNALIRGDGKAAAGAMADHLRHGGQYAVDLLRQRGSIKSVEAVSSDRA